MIRIIFTSLILLLLQACQVSEDVSSAKQMGTSTTGADTPFNVILQNDGWKKLGDPISITLLHDKSVNVTGAPYINVQIGSSTRRFYYHSGTGSNAILFRYVVTPLDLDTDGISISNSITLNGGTITNSPSEIYTVNIPTTLQIPMSLIRVDGVVPTLTQVTAPTAGNYYTGQNLRYGVSFSEPVFVAGLPGFDVALNSGNAFVEYLTGSGSTQLTFQKVLTAGNIDPNGFSTSSNLYLDASNHITIKDEAGNLVSTYFPVTSSPNILVNIAGPTITGVSVPAASTYLSGQNLDFTVTFNSAVNVTGVPVIPMNLTTGVAYARYVSGSGTANLLFRHTVVTGEQDLNGIILLSPLGLNSGTIKNLAGTINAALTYTVPATTTVVVDAVASASIISSILPTSSTYIEGQTLDFTLNYNRAVTVTGTPQLQLNLNSGVVNADYQAGLSTPTSVVFRYTTTTSDEDMDGITLASPLSLNGGTIQDSNLLNAGLVFNIPDATGIKVDGVAPTITTVPSPTIGTYITNQNITVQMTFSEAVVVTGTPRIPITLGMASVFADYVSGSNSNTLTFKYLVQVGDYDNDGIDIVSPMDLNGGTIKDLRNHDLSVLTFVSPVTTSVLVDSSSPGISSVTPPANATYRTGDNIDFVVNWSESVSFSGSPRLALNIGGSTVYAHYLPVGSTPTASIFRYTIPSAMNDNDGIGLTSPVQLNGGTIKDTNANNAALTFVAPVLTGVLVDGFAPGIASVTPPANGSYRTGMDVDFTVNWTEAVTIVGTPVLKLIIGPSLVNATYQPGLSTPTASVFRYTVFSGDLDTNGIGLNTTIYLSGATIQDAIGNNAALSLTAPPLTQVLVDGVAPIVTTVTPPPDDTYRLSTSVDFRISWTETMIVTGVPRIAIDVGGSTEYAYYNAGASNSTQLVFRYTVGLNEVDTDGVDVLPALPMTPEIDLDGGTITDVAGNDAVLTFYRPVTSGVLIDGVRPVIMSIVAPGAGTYIEGQNVDFTVNWSEMMTVTGTPRLTLTVGSTTIYADYVSGTGTSALVFRYTVQVGDEDLNGIYRAASVDLNGGTIQDPVLNDGYPTYFASTYASVRVDGKAPAVTASFTLNKGYKQGTYLDMYVNYHEAVTVTGFPRIQLNINGWTKYATYFSGTGTTQLRFRYYIENLSYILDLDGIGVAAAIDLNGGTIRDSVLHAASLTVSFTNKIYIHYAGMMARYHFSDNDYNLASCGSNSCITSVTDISGDNRHINSASSPGPVHSTGYGSNSTEYAQFNNLSSLNLPSMTYRYMVVVMKTPTYASPFFGSSYYSLVSNVFSTNYMAFESHLSSRSHRFSQSTAMKTNGGTLTGYSTNHGVYWNTDTNAIYQFHNNATGTTLSSSPRLGGGTFNGQIAEIIFFNTSYLSPTYLNNITSQLNAIHGAY